ncbi:helix-turn-helix domain-containing protein [Streptomyces sp. NPDC097619]|uniref:helix-turn-helix domain-containing protein n=1 Tax=Streptomyces sp. NPDC097619 TaxID=3157228 RepID=UPI00332FCB7A
MTAHQIIPRQVLPVVPRPARTSRPGGLPEPAERRRLREQWGLTPRQVAVAFGVTPATVGSWERGRSTPRGTRREAYRRFLEGLAQHAPAPTETTRPSLPTSLLPPAPAAPRRTEPSRPASSPRGPESRGDRPGAARVTPCPDAGLRPANGPTGTPPAPPERTAPPVQARVVLPEPVLLPVSDPAPLGAAWDPVTPERVRRLRLLGAAACVWSLALWLLITCPPPF